MRIQSQLQLFPWFYMPLHIKGERNTYGVNRLGSKRRAVTELKGIPH